MVHARCVKPKSHWKHMKPHAFDATPISSWDSLTGLDQWLLEYVRWKSWMSSHDIVNTHVCIIPCHGIDKICIHTMDFDVMSIDMPCGDICVILVYGLHGMTCYGNIQYVTWVFGNSIEHYKHKLKQWAMLFWAHQKLVKVAPLTFLPPFPPPLTLVPCK